MIVRIDSRSGDKKPPQSVRRSLLHRSASLRIILGLAVFLFVARAGLTQSRYTITGNVNCPDAGVLHIYLFDESGFSVPFTGIQGLKIEIATAESAVVPFQFSDVPAGRYGIRCYLDKNGNGKLDRGLFGPTEPWGFAGLTKTLRGRPRFEEVSFPVYEDILGLRIELTKGRGE